MGCQRRFWGAGGSELCLEGPCSLVRLRGVEEVRMGKVRCKWEVTKGVSHPLCPSRKDCPPQRLPLTKVELNPGPWFPWLCVLSPFQGTSHRCWGQWDTLGGGHCAGVSHLSRPAQGSGGQGMHGFAQQGRVVG